MRSLSDYGIFGIDSGTRGQQKTLCPECSHTRKTHPNEKCLSVNVDDGTWFCHHCGWSGGLGNSSEKQRWKEIPKPAPVKFKKGTTPDSLQNYFDKRCLTKEVLNKEQISAINAYDKEWIAFPYVMEGEVVNVKYRALDAKEFRQIKNGYKTFYRLDSIKNYKQAIICEGEIDALSFVQSGIENVVSVPEGGVNPEAKNIAAKMSYVDNTIQYFEHLDTIYLAVDNDPVGRRLCEELARRYGKERCMIVRYPEGCKDANDVLCKYGETALWQAVHTAKPYPIDGVKFASTYQDSILDIYDHGFQTGVITGSFPIFDNHFTWHEGQLTVITGVPSFGKSNFMDNVSIELCRNAGWKVAVFSPENPSPEVWLVRLIEIYTGQAFENGSYNRISKEQTVSALQWLDSNMFYIMPDSDTFALDDVLATANSLIRRYGINMLIIDPWNNLEMQMGKGETENLYVGRTLAKMRMFAMKTGIHIALIAHPRKMQSTDEFGNYEVPTPYSISGSSNFYNIPHNVLVVHRDFDADGKSLARIIIAKVKNKYIGKVNKTGILFTYTSHNQTYKEIPSHEGKTWS